MPAFSLSSLRKGFGVVLVVSQLAQSGAPLSRTASPATERASPQKATAPAVPTLTPARWKAARLLTAPNSIDITAAGFEPDMLQVTAGQIVTITNQDARTRTISFTSAQRYKAFLPLVWRGAAASAAGGTVAFHAAGDLIALAPGQSVTRSFAAAANVTVNDADNPALQAVLLVTPPPLNADGRVEGVVLDYQTKAPIAGARVRALDTSFETTTDASGRYRLPLPGGDYTLVLFANGYSFANRKVTAQSFTPTGVETITLVPLDAQVAPVGAAGGVATNTVGNTNVVFAAGAVSSTKAMRLTWLPVNAQTGDFAALPGPFTDGNMPIGFVMFEPDGTRFSAPVTWTIAYTGDLPIGTYTPCYYWIESEARWGEPVDGYVVDLGNGKKGLRAVLPHFSSYGFAPPPPPVPDKPQKPPETPDEPEDPTDPENNPDAPNNDCEAGSQINLMSGELCQTVGTLSLPAIGQLPSQITARYHSLNVTTTRVISTAFGPASGQLTPQATWTFKIAGRTFSGAGKQPYVEWDSRDANGVLLPPGAHEGTLTPHWTYDYTYNDCTYPTPPTCRLVHRIDRFSPPTPWFVQVRRDDLSPWGRGWFGPHDMLLVDRGDTVSLIEGDGRQVSFARNLDGTYRSPAADFSVLTRQGDGTWTRASKDGSVLTFNADGRLIRIADRYGNAQVLLYEPNGKVIPEGSWGLTTRIRRVLDTSGNQWDYAYDVNGWLSRITDSAGRALRLAHDAQGHLTAVTDPLNQTETFAYGADGHMSGHTDRRGFTTTYALDGRGRVLTRTWPTSTALQMSYDRLGVRMLTDRGTPLVTMLDGNFSPVSRYNGVYTMTTTYNADLLPASQDTPPQQTLYDAQGNVIHSFTARHVAFEYGGPFQQVSQMATGDGTDTRFEYDAAGNLTRMTDALGQAYQMGYDARGQLLSITDPLGHVTAFEHDARGQVTRVTDPMSRTYTFSYDEAGNRIASRDPLSRTTRMEYDALSRLTAVVDALNGRAALQFDANDNLTRILDQTARPIIYAYDALDRVTGVTYADGGTTSYTYDGSGNVTGITDARGLGRAYVYDAAGRLVQRQVQSGRTSAYAYDTYDQLTSAADGILTQTYAYVGGTAGYPLRARQQAAGLPLSVTVDYQYSNGQVRAPGAAPLGMANAQAQLVVNDGQTGDPSSGARSAPLADPPRTSSSPSRGDAPAAPLQTAAPAAATCVSIASGNWSSGSTWSCGAAPTDTAIIAGGWLVTLDESPTIRSLVFERGTLDSPTQRTLNVTESLQFTTGDLKLFRGLLQIDNHGLATWQDGDISADGQHTLNNLAGAVFDVSADGRSMYVNGGNGWATLNNHGTLRKSAGAGNAIIGGRQGWMLNNNGLVQVLSGTLTLGDDFRVGTSTGEYRVTAGATLYFWRGGHSLAAGSVITGAGTVALGGYFEGSVYHGVVHFGGAYAVGNTIIDGGMPCFDNGAPGAAQTGGLELRAGYLGGTGVVRATRAFTWTGGEMRQEFGSGGATGCGPITPSGSLEIAAAARGLISATADVLMSSYGITNGGILVWDGNGNIQGRSMRISNLPGGLLDIRNDRFVSVGGGQGTGLIDNAGVLRKSGGAGTTVLDGGQGPDVVNSGIVEARSGALQLRQYRQTAGATRLAGGSLIAGTGGVLTLIGGWLTGTGTIAGSVTNVGAVVAPGNSAGTITIQGNYTQGPTGTLAIEVGGVTPGTQHDWLDVSGSASLSGALSVTYTSGFAPNGAQRVTFLTHASRSGAFAPVTNPLSATHPVNYAATRTELGQPLPAFVLPGDGRLSGVSLTSNGNRAQTLKPSYELIGRLATLRSAGYSTYTLAYAYDAAGRLTRRQASAGNAPAYGYAYDAANQLTRLAISTTSATSALLTLDYSYDAAGNITGIASSRDGATSYTYDALNRLTGVNSPGFSASYGYDAAGNRTSASGVTFAYDAGGRLVSGSDGASYTYDAAGNLLTRTRNGQTDTFVWDALGQLARINYADGTHSEYGYDDGGRRISKRGRNGATVYYTYLGLNLAQELDAVGSVVASYTYDGLDRPISVWRGGQTYFYLLDHLGNVLGLVDGSGAVASTYRYDPWGNVITRTGSIANPLRFTAREWDDESGLYFYRARYYDPQIGRFISRDPIGLYGGLNSYAYVEANTIRRTDPMGLFQGVAAAPAVISGSAAPAVGLFAVAGTAAFAAGFAAGTVANHFLEDSIQDLLDNLFGDPPDPEAGGSGGYGGGICGGSGGCPPCPTPPPGFSRTDTTHPHHPCPGDHTHKYEYEYNQNPETCECFLRRVEVDVICH